MFPKKYFSPYFSQQCVARAECRKISQKMPNSKTKPIQYAKLKEMPGLNTVPREDMPKNPGYMQTTCSQLIPVGTCQQVYSQHINITVCAIVSQKTRVRELRKPLVSVNITPPPLNNFIRFNPGFITNTKCLLYVRF